MTDGILGVDIGNVIINHRVVDKNDKILYKDCYSSIPAVEGVFEALHTLTTERFKDNVFLVSKCTSWAQKRILSWLRDNNFYKRTGIKPEKVFFCREGSEKKKICGSLGITHFIDNRLEVLSHLIDQVSTLYLFQPDEAEVDDFIQFLPEVTVVISWQQIVEKIKCFTTHPSSRGLQVDANNACMPVDLLKDNHDCRIVSFSLPRTDLREPFLTDSLALHFRLLNPQTESPLENKLLVQPLHYDRNDLRVILTPVDQFLRASDKIKADKKINFIFHMSRCGSTLLTRMLSSNRKFFVLSEPPIINILLNPALKLPAPYDRFSLLRAAIGAMSKCAPKECESVFVKFRSWNVLYLNDITEQFPHARWMFVHRHGLEVLSSVLKKPPGWLRSRRSYSKYFAPFLNVSEDILYSIGDDEFASRLLGAFCHTAASSCSPHGSYLDYKKWRENFFHLLRTLWDINLSDTEKQAMFAVSRLYSKDVSGTVQFESDSKMKREQTTKSQRDLADMFIETQRRLLDRQKES